MIKVIKIGGNVVDNPVLLREFVKDFAAMPGMKVLVHGGGVMASQMQKEMGMTPVMVAPRASMRLSELKSIHIIRSAAFTAESAASLLLSYAIMLPCSSKKLRKSGNLLGTTTLGCFPFSSRKSFIPTSDPMASPSGLM